MLEHALNNEKNKVKNMVNKAAKGVLRDQMQYLQETVAKQSQIIFMHEKKEKNLEMSLAQIKDNIEASNAKFRSDVKLENIHVENELKRTKLNETSLM